MPQNLFNSLPPAAKDWVAGKLLKISYVFSAIKYLLTEKGKLIKLSSPDKGIKRRAFIYIIIFSN